MDLHQNARLTFRSREALAKKIMIERLTVNAAAAAFTVSRSIMIFLAKASRLRKVSRAFW